MDVLRSRLYLAPIAVAGLWILFKRLRAARDPSSRASHHIGRAGLTLWPYYTAFCGFSGLTVVQVILALGHLSLNTKRTIFLIGTTIAGALFLVGVAAMLILPIVNGFTEGKDSRP